MAITLIVEDGTGQPDANAYVSTGDATAYWTNRANAAWAAATADEQAAALIQATQYLDARYTFKGDALTTTQALAWPRQPNQANVTTFGSVQAIFASTDDSALYAWPVKRVKDATCEAALQALSGSLYTDESSAIVTSEKVDVIAVTYADHSRNGGQVRIAIVDDILKPLLAGGRYSISLARA